MRVAVLLLTRDVRALRTLTRPNWLRRALAWIIFVAACVVMGLHNSASPTQSCTDAAPCLPDVPAALTAGLLVAAAVAGFLHARVAAWLASGFAIAVVGYDLLHPALASPEWLYVIDVAFVALCFGVGKVDRARPASGTAMTWLAGVRHERPPAPPHLPRPTVRWGAASVACALVVLGLVAWSWFGQTGMDGRQRASTTVVGEVTAQVDDVTVRVRLPDGRLTDIDVLDARGHPVGQPLALYTDAAGLHQPVSEPYDLTGWLVLAALAGGVGLACRVRGAERAAGLRALFDQPQPVTQVYVRAGWGRVAVYPADARPGEPAITELRCLPMTQALLDAVPADDSDDRQVALLPTRPALLYGVPAPEHWCTVVVDGIAAAPVRPLRTKVGAPPFTEPVTATGWRDPAFGQLPLRPEEVDALSAADRDDNPYQVHTHIQHWAIGYALIAAMPLVLVTPAKFLPTLQYGTAFVIAALATALACAVGWRLFLRSRLAWNAGGVAVVGAIGSGRFRWHQVHRIEPDRRDVTISAGASHLVVGAHGGVGNVTGLGSTGHGSTGRSAEQLANALRYAKERTAPDVDPPRLVTPTPPAGLYALWLVTTPLIAWTLQALSGR
ncbi:MAG: hypothetical protein JWP76_5093 [Dactylosporangium sp.]|nr:hypothetical protein [Dactylosporangium sp.]